MKTSRLFWIPAAIALVGCATGVAPTELALINGPEHCADLVMVPAIAPQTDTDPETERVLPGYVLSLAVFGHLDISGEFTVAPDGTIALPLIGQFKVAGLTTAEISDLLSGSSTDNGYLTHSRIIVTILYAGEIFVLGEVARPGLVPYKRGMNVLQAIARAGALTYRGNPMNIALNRGPCSFKVQADTPLLPSDVIEVSEASVKGRRFGAWGPRRMELL